MSQRVFTRDLRKRVQTRLRSYLAAAYSAEVALGYEGRACVSPHLLGLTRESTVSTLTAGMGAKIAFTPREDPVGSVVAKMLAVNSPALSGRRQTEESRTTR